MRHIFHTCLLALRLVSSVGNGGKETASLDLFSNALMNRAFNIVFFDPGIYERKSENNYYVNQEKRTNNG
jgi:hypothetical protein